jgi:hypothetical protein
MILVADWWPLGAYSHPQQSYQVTTVDYRRLGHFGTAPPMSGSKRALLVAMHRLGPAMTALTRRRRLSAATTMFDNRLAYTDGYEGRGADGEANNIE